LDAYFLAIGSVVKYPTRIAMKPGMAFVYLSSGFIAIDVNASLEM
jgi:hypothetical protein